MDGVGMGSRVFDVIKGYWLVCSLREGTMWPLNHEAFGSTLESSFRYNVVISRKRPTLNKHIQLSWCRSADVVVIEIFEPLGGTFFEISKTN